MQIQDRIRMNRIPGVRIVLVVLSAQGMPFDLEALRYQIRFSYFDAEVYFITTLARPLGPPAPLQVDLLIDLTGPAQRQSFFFAKSLRRRARVAVGRNAGFFRRKVYDRVFDEKAVQAQLPSESASREALIQKNVLALAGIAFACSGSTPPDLGATIALELPPLLTSQQK